MSDISVDMDAFASTLSGLLDDLGVSVEEEVKPAVRDAAKIARKEWRNRANNTFKPMGGEHRYGNSITYTVKGRSHETSAEVGSKQYPGLPHLLEKGHATIGGGSVAGRPHISLAAEVAFGKFEGDISEAVDRALESL